MTANRKEQICKLLKGIETGDPEAVSVVNEDKYIQHNPQTHEGSEGLAVLFKRLSQTSPKVNIVRIFEDGDYIFADPGFDFGTGAGQFEPDDLRCQHVIRLTQHDSFCFNTPDTPPDHTYAVDHCGV